MTSSTSSIQYLQLNTYGRVVFPTSNVVIGSIQASMVEGSWGSTVLTVEQSDDGVTWYGLATAVTFTAAGIKNDLASLTVPFLSVAVTTLSGASAFAAVSAHFKGDA